MKAEEPGSVRKAEKYGMPIEYADRIVQRHFDVLGEQQAIHAARMAHNVRVGPAMLAALNRAPESVTPSQSAMAGSQDWRGKLGRG